MKKPKREIIMERVFTEKEHVEAIRQATLNGWAFAATYLDAHGEWAAAEALRMELQRKKWGSDAAKKVPR